MNAKTTFSVLCVGTLCLCSCQRLTDALAANAKAALPFGDTLVYGVSGMCSDVKDACTGTSAPREDELDDKQIVFSGTLEESDGIYQIRDVVSFQHGGIFRISGGINRLNKAPEVRRQGVLPASAYTLNDIGTFNCYERTGGATAIFKEQKNSTEGERYILTFASSDGGTYTYENRKNGVLIGQGDGTFDVENL